MRLYEKNGVVMVEEKIGNNTINRFYSAINHLKVDIFENKIDVSVYDYLDNYNIDYVGDVVISINGIDVSRETLSNGFASFDLSESEVGIYELRISCEGLKDKVVEYEKN